MYCRNCGHEIVQGSNFCTYCAHPVEEKTPVKRKNRTLAGLLAMFLGGLGVHSFYLGHKERGFTQLVMSVVGGFCSCGIATLVVMTWGIIEGTQLFAGFVNTDAKGNPLTE